MHAVISRSKKLSGRTHPAPFSTLERAHQIESALSLLRTISGNPTLDSLYAKPIELLAAELRHLNRFAAKGVTSEDRTEALGRAILLEAAATHLNSILGSVITENIDKKVLSALFSQAALLRDIAEHSR